MSHFNKNKDEQLINAVKAKPVLYLARHPENRNCIAKYHAWHDISQTLDIPIPAIKKRWKHLRDHYNKKVKQTKNNANNKWEYMPLLGFLKNKTDVDGEMSSGVDDDRTDNEDIVIKIEEYSGSEHSNLTDNVNVNVEEKNKDLDDVLITPVTKEDTNKKDDINKNEDTKEKCDAVDDFVERTELKRNFESLNLAISDTNINKVGNSVDKEIEKIKKIEQSLKNLSKNLERNFEVPTVAKKKIKYTDEHKDNGDKETEVDDDAKTEEISNILNLVRRRLESILMDIEKCEASAKRSGMKAKAQISPVHRFFEAVAHIVALFPPHLIAEARSTTCTMINELEKQYLQTNKWLYKDT